MKDTRLYLSNTEKSLLTQAILAYVANVEMKERNRMAYLGIVHKIGRM